MKLITSLALAALVAAALSAPAGAQSPATVDLQVEGASGAVVPTATLTTTTATVNKDGQTGHDCTGTSAAGALEAATGGDWDGPWYGGLGYAVERVQDEVARFSDGRYFAFYVDGRAASSGVCGVELEQGDDVLLYVACAGATTGCFAGEPLHATAPRRVAPGERFTVTVREASTDGSGETTLSPSAGADVDGTRTGADGTASVALADRGAQLVTVTKGTRPPERVPVCVTDGADGRCGTTRPAEPGRPQPQPQPQPQPEQPVATTRPTAPAVVRGRITAIREGARFRRGRVPRVLRGTVPSGGSGVDRVRLRLTRRHGPRCFTYDADRERQRRLARCGAARGEWFPVGDRPAWEYQLPFSLPRGRWVLDLEVRDRQGRTSKLERGNTRVVFTVR